MIIDTVEISNLGLWENIFLKFDKGINIIQGENGVGKTTLLALLYSLFHDSGIIKFTNKNQEAYICMNLHDSKEKLVLKKVYKKGQSGYFVSSFSDIKKIARMDEEKVFIFSGEFLDYDCQLNAKMVKNAVKLLKNVDMERYFSLAYEGVYMSQGQQSVIQILNLLYLIPSNSILLLDAPFAKVDLKVRNDLIEVMKRLKDMQIILTTSVIEEVEARGAYVVSATSSYDPRTAVGKYMQLMELANARFQNDEKRATTIENSIKALLKGRWIGKAPRGYDQRTTQKEQIITINEEGKL